MYAKYYYLKYDTRINHKQPLFFTPPRFLFLTPPQPLPKKGEGLLLRNKIELLIFNLSFLFLSHPNHFCFNFAESEKGRGSFTLNNFILKLIFLLMKLRLQKLLLNKVLLKVEINLIKGFYQN